VHFIIKLLGVCTAVCVVACLMNLLLKQISREYIGKLSPGNENFIAMYRKFMRLMIRNHRIFGFSGIGILTAHGLLAYTQIGLSLTGLIALFLMSTMVCSGSYGYYFKKDYRSAWLDLHRMLAFLLLVGVIIHIPIPFFI